MERKIRKFKRTINKKDIYGVNFKNQLNIDNFEKYNIFYQLDKEEIKNKIISIKISKLPEEVQKKIYIMSMRYYWRDNFKNTILKPMWCDYKKYLDNELKKCIIDNVHFMHLEFNTLEENKKWIPGCECNFCQNYKNNNEKEVQSTLVKIFQDQSYFFTKCINCYDVIPNKWNMNVIYYGDVLNYTTFTIFDPLADMFHDQIKDDPQESPMYFSEELMNMYSNDSNNIIESCD